MIRRAGPLVIAGCLLLTVVLLAARRPGPPEPMADRVQAVASTIRCPVCSDLTVADSPSRLAAEMRQAIEADLRSGETPDQIRSGFAASYGEWVLLDPPKRGLDLLVWAIAAVVPVGGLCIAALVLRRLNRAGASRIDLTEGSAVAR
jgi:cytochrome c-type biogenesis protein CcmH